MKRTIVCPLVLIMCMLASMPSAFAELDAYMTIEGSKQGNIKGDVTQQGREDQIRVIAYEHDVASPQDAASGKRRGRIMHGAFKIVKEIDKSSPLLYSALVHNENLKEVILQFWQPSAGGQEIQYYTIKLTNASITGIKSEMFNNRAPEKANYKVQETVSFSYENIEWTWNDGGITAEAQSPNPKAR